MTTPLTWKGVVKHLAAQPVEVRDYFEHFSSLAEDYPWEVSLSYVFGRIEIAHRMALYCGAVKRHRAERTLARHAIQSHHMTRDDFQNLFENVHGKAIPKAIAKKLKEAESVRDKVMHGKTATAEEQRRALTDVFDYAKQLNDFVRKESGFKPLDDLRGFKGRAKPLDKSTTRWLLKGLGFGIQ